MRTRWLKPKSFFCHFQASSVHRQPSKGQDLEKCEKKSKSLHPSVHVHVPTCTCTCTDVHAHVPVHLHLPVHVHVPVHVLMYMDMHSWAEDR